MPAMTPPASVRATPVMAVDARRFPRRWIGHDRRAARPEWHVRAEDRAETGAAARADRRDDPVALRPRGLDPRHRGTSARSVWGDGVTRTDLECHRGGDRRNRDLA